MGFVRGLAVGLLAFPALVGAVAYAWQDKPQPPASPAAALPTSLRAPRPEWPTDIIDRADPSEPVRALLDDGHFAIENVMGTHDRACFTRGRDLFRKGLKEAQKRHEPRSEEAARVLLARAEKAITRYDAAAATARRDVASGRLRYMTSGMGLMPADFSEREAHLKGTYGVELVGVAGCDVNYEELAEQEGYNSVSLAAIEKKWGKDAADDVAERRPAPKPGRSGAN
jgi:hypothetical protein